MIIREVVSLYKLNWKAHLWSFLIPLGIIMFAFIDGDKGEILPLMGVGFYWFNGVKLTLKKERESGIFKTIRMLPIRNKNLIISRVIYFYLNCFIYLGILLPFFTHRNGSIIGTFELIWMFIGCNLLSIYQYIKHGKKKKSSQKEIKNNLIVIIGTLASVVLGLIPIMMIKILGISLLVVVWKRVISELRNYYPINRELNEEERY